MTFYHYKVFHLRVDIKAITSFFSERLFWSFCGCVWNEARYWSDVRLSDFSQTFFLYHLWRRKNGFLIESHEDIVLLVGLPDCWSRGILSDDLIEMSSIKPTSFWVSFALVVVPLWFKHHHSVNLAYANVTFFFNSRNLSHYWLAIDIGLWELFRIN